MRKLILLLAVSTFFVSVNAQIVEKEKELKEQTVDSLEGWKTNGFFAVNFAQVAFKNWAAGGVNSIAVNSLVSFNATYTKGNNTWENSLDLGYGILNQGKGDTKTQMKTDDKIDFASKFGRKASKSLYYAALLNFKTQFTDGFDYEVDSTNAISKLMAPAYLVVAVGIDYKPNNTFSAFVAPLTGKTTFVLDTTFSNVGAFGVEPGQSIRNEFGGYAKFIYQDDVMENVNLKAKLDLFSNYIENPQNIDLSFEMIVGMKVNKYITASIGTNLLYDDDVDIAVDDNGDGEIDAVGPRLQFKEYLAIGLSIKF